MEHANPTEQEIAQWLTDVARHSAHVEYYLTRLSINPGAEERPHDVVGTGNKLDWNVIKGLAIKARKDINFKDCVLPSIEYHRKQKHHVMWNKPNGAATPNDMRLGAIDAICSMLENRSYHGGNHSFDEIAEVIESEKTPEHCKKWMREVLFVMREIPRPDLEAITVRNIPNVGLPDEIYYDLVTKFDLTKMSLIKSGYASDQFTPSYAIA